MVFLGTFCGTVTTTTTTTSSDSWWGLLWKKYIDAYTYSQFLHYTLSGEGVGGLHWGGKRAKQDGKEREGSGASLGLVIYCMMSDVLYGPYTYLLYLSYVSI